MESNEDEILGDLDLLRRAATSVVAERTFTIEGLAAQTRTSVRSLQRQCRSVGVTPTQLIEQARVRAALKLFRDWDRNIHDVASAVGYTNSRTFRRAVRRWTGMSPRELRAAVLRVHFDSNDRSTIVEGMTPPEPVNLDSADIDQMESLRRSIAMGQEGSWALKREPALTILGQLIQELRTSRVQ